MEMKKLKDSIAKDLWVVLLDLVAVNLSYFLALIIRFYVNFQLRPVAVDRYLPAWTRFAPFYSIIAIVFFIVFKLYGGLWRYAGVNDMNRIILANICTALVHVAGTSLFFTRMPITYYIIGAILQFVFVVIIRFSYRILMVEKKRLRSLKVNKIPALIVGTGENGRRVMKHLEESDAYRPVAIAGSGFGTMDGVPIITLQDASWDKIQTVFIADPLLSGKDRQLIKERCDKNSIDLQDYTGFFSNLGGKLSLTELLSAVSSPITIVIDDKESEYPDSATALAALTEKYSVKELSGNPLKIKLEKKQKTSTQDALAQAYAAVMGEEYQTSARNQQKG